MIQPASPVAKAIGPQQVTRLIAVSLCVALAAILFATRPASAGQVPYLVKDVQGGTAGSDPEWLTPVGDTLYFAADGGSKGRELWKTDGTAAGTQRVKDIWPGMRGSDPRSLVNVNGLLIFAANDGSNGVELWRSDGTKAGTERIRDIRPGFRGSHPYAWPNGVVGDTLYFSADDGARGRELWKTNGTRAGTTLVKDIAPDPDSYGPGTLGAIGDTMYFVAYPVADDDNYTGVLYRTDGTTAGTRRVRDEGGDVVRGFVTWPRIVGPLLYFGLNEEGLWRTDGTQAGTREILHGEVWDLTPSNGTLYFRAATVDQIWTTNGTSGGTSMVVDLPDVDGWPTSIADLTDVAGTLYFTTDYNELWMSDGTADGTILIAGQLSIYSGAVGQLTALGSTLYFAGPGRNSICDLSGYSPAPCLRLWTSDGTDEGTVKVVGGPHSRDFRDLTAVGEGVYFVAGTAGSGTELWRYIP